MQRQTMTDMQTSCNQLTHKRSINIYDATYKRVLISDHLVIFNSEEEPKVKKKTKNKGVSLHQVCIPDFLLNRIQVRHSGHGG